MSAPPPTRPPVFFINLDRVPERADYMSHHLAERGVVGATRWSAVDALRLADYAPLAYVLGAGQRWELEASGIGCFESHRRLWQHVVAQNFPVAVILEDDLIVGRQFAAMLDDLGQIADKFDVLKLDRTPNRAERYRRLIRLCERIAARAPLQMTGSTGAYAITNAGCRKLIARSVRYSDSVDDFITFPRKGWRCFQLFPALCVQVQFSDLAHRSSKDFPECLQKSERMSHCEINHHCSKGPVSYRVSEAARRFRQKLFRKSGGVKSCLAKGGFYGQVPVELD